MMQIEGFNWFACWICLAIGLIIGMAISALFAGPKR